MSNLWMCCRFLKDKHDRLAEQRAAEEGSLQPEQGSDEASSEQADTQPHPSWDTAGSLDDSDDSSSEDDDISRHVDTSSDDDSDDDSDDLSSRQRSALQPPPRPPVQLSILQQLSGAPRPPQAALAVVVSVPLVLSPDCHMLHWSPTSQAWHLGKRRQMQRVR